MDRVRAELLPPLLIAEMHRDAHRRALADQAAAGGSGWLLRAQLGAMLVHAGCRLVETGRREMVAASSPSLNAALACGCTE
jgi:hypothetical protein